MIEVTKKIDGLRSLSQLFTQTNFEKIVRKGDFDQLNYRLDRHVSKYQKLPFSDVLRHLHNHLQREYRSEYFYKNGLLNKLVLGKYSLKTTTVLNEFKIGSSLADLVLLNGDAKVFEIKTELDSLSKLEKQLDDYSRFAKSVTVVCSPSHSKNTLSKLAETPFGILEYTKKNTFKELKKTEMTSEKLTHEAIFKTLRKNEYLRLVRSELGEIPDVPNTKIFKDCLNLIKEINVERFQDLAIRQLKKRAIKCPDCLQSESTPKELRHLCYTMDLKENEYLSLYSFLSKQA